MHPAAYSMDSLPQWAGPKEFDAGRALDALLVSATHLGFRHVTALVWLPSPGARHTAHLVSNLPAPWLDAYRTKGFAAIDPIAHWCLSSKTPLVWGDALLDRAPAEFRSAARAYGLCHGWSQAIHDGLGVRGMFTLSRPTPAVGGDEVQRQQYAMRRLAHRAHRLVLADLRAQWAKALPEPLTAREQDVLRWAADGKTAKDTAAILGIQHTTARFHINNAVRKLQADNITAAVFRALVLGMLHGSPEGSVPATSTE